MAFEAVQSISRIQQETPQTPAGRRFCLFSQVVPERAFFSLCAVEHSGIPSAGSSCADLYALANPDQNDGQQTMHPNDAQKLNVGGLGSLETMGG